MFNCRECGACCAHPTDDKWIGVTLEDAKQLDHLLLQEGDIEAYAMWMAHKRCCALVGTLGKKVFCKVYDKRPSICHRITPGDAVCLKMRAYYLKMTKRMRD